jgi:hypothetical protein
LIIITCPHHHHRLHFMWRISIHECHLAPSLGLDQSISNPHLEHRVTPNRFHQLTKTKLGLSARQLWSRLLAPVSLAALVPMSDDRLGSWWLQQRLRVDHVARPPFDSLLLLICWCIWKERNKRTFWRPTSDVDIVIQALAQEADEWVEAGFSCLAALCSFWSSQIWS